MRYFAHTAVNPQRWEPLAEHLEKVARRAARYAAAFGLAQEGRLAGLLHDLGKYGDLFQRRLRGEVRGVDHWSAGAWAALMHAREQGYATALAVQGHHMGLQRGDRDSLQELRPETLATSHPQGLQLSEPHMDILLERMQADGLDLPDLETSICPWGRADHLAAMLDVRMLFSALVDADFVETMSHFAAPAARPVEAALEPERAWVVLRRHLKRLRRRKAGEPEVASLRNDLLEECLAGARRPPGLFTLSAPTGAGKTLSMLAFALKHAIRHRLRRLIVVIPYLTIIEQTVSVYREIFEPHFGEGYILEHHSLAGTRPDRSPGASGPREVADEQVESSRLAGMLAENWGAPIVVTTSVQFLESLFADRPSACRKLHNIARSVVLFDEVQTLPPHLAMPTLAALAHISQRYRTTVVFATATQPAFTHLHHRIVDNFQGPGWRPAELVSSPSNAFGRVRRTRIYWPDLDRPVSWTEVAARVAEYERVLCVVNLKRDAVRLASMLRDSAAGGLFHLSTNMCPAHRKSTLQIVRRRLDRGAPCRLISTQCVEAGVDVDFPVVFRAWGPLEAIAQAAGRCNRNGTMERGEVRVFLPENAAYPPGAYKQAADVARMVFEMRGEADMDIEDPALYEEYYKMLYDITKIADVASGRAAELMDAINRRDFVEVARLYRIVDQDGINVLVPYDPAAYRDLAAEVRERGLRVAWIRKAMPHAVALFRPRGDESMRAFLEPVPVRHRERSDEWFIYLREEDYDRDLLGLLPAHSPEAWMI